MTKNKSWILYIMQYIIALYYSDYSIVLLFLDHLH